MDARFQSVGTGKASSFQRIPIVFCARRFPLCRPRRAAIVSASFHRSGAKLMDTVRRLPATRIRTRRKGVSLFRYSVSHRQGRALRKRLP